MARLNSVMEFYEEAMNEIALKRPGFSKYLIDVCVLIVKIVTRHQGMPDWAELPEELRQRLQSWKHSAAELQTSASASKINGGAQPQAASHRQPLQAWTVRDLARSESQGLSA